ncbi:NAD(P)/FAD-dependent oxidoreductase [Massilia endophytica]|uniref:NAD(P)/FAD-dependent oxidoreductase n=1 Tax=Massilia endophytica TaxID=2899220 RepID=UPI001E3EC32C|nr:NAD(P)/FAD-dependent oxidoreductase [Massilia endophytica]UGQ48717.1 NAD(P)/FAD-dependent oxidoreductase [Massilia endophytica]
MLDVIIVGGGFAGIAAALQMARARRRILVLDGGSPRNRNAVTAHGFFGHDGKTPRELRETAHAQLRAYPGVQLLEEVAIAARPLEQGFEVTVGNGRTERASRLILAAGVRDELPALPGLRERWGRTVLHCPYCHGYEAGPGPFGVLASGESSAEQALLVSDWAPVVYFTQGLHEPGAEVREQMAARRVRIEAAPVVELLGEAPALEAAKLADGRVIPLDALFVATRVDVSTPIVSQLGCAMDESPKGRLVRVNEMKQTTVAGVFAAGDLSTPFGNASMAAASGVMAGVAAHRSLIFGL